MGRVLDPGDCGFPWLGQPKRENRGAASVLPVRGLEHEATVVLAARGLPAAAVADSKPGLLGEGGEPLLHRRPRRHHEGAIHERNNCRLVCRLVGDETVLVVPLIRARPGFNRRIDFRPRHESLVERKAPEHAAWRLITGDDSVLDTDPREAVARL